MVGKPATNLLIGMIDADQVSGHGQEKDERRRWPDSRGHRHCAPAVAHGLFLQPTRSRNRCRR